MDTLLTIKQAAQELGIATRTIQRQIAKGEIKPERIGNMWVIKRSTLKAIKIRPAHRPRVKCRKQPTVK